MFNGDVKWYDYFGATAGVTFAVELTINGVIETAGNSGLIVMMTKIIGKSGGYTVKHNYPIDHYPTHFHIYGDDIHQGSHGIRVGLDGNPLKWEPNLPYGVRKAIKKLWKEIINALEQWMR